VIAALATECAENDTKSFGMPGTFNGLPTTQHNKPY
jgi:hypothetical protein